MDTSAHRLKFCASPTLLSLRLRPHAKSFFPFWISFDPNRHKVRTFLRKANNLAMTHYPLQAILFSLDQCFYNLAGSIFHRIPNSLFAQTNKILCSKKKENTKCWEKLGLLHRHRPNCSHHGINIVFPKMLTRCLYFGNSTTCRFFGFWCPAPGIIQWV